MNLALPSQYSLFYVQSNNDYDNLMNICALDLKKKKSNL